MGTYRKATRADSFESEVRRRFGPLATTLGMSDPVDDNKVIRTVEYTLKDLSYWWMYNHHDQGIDVLIRLEGEDAQRSIWLWKLVVAAKLGAPQHIHTDAKTWRALQKAIESHTEWLIRLHPRLSGPEAAAFLDNAGAGQHRRRGPAGARPG